MQSLLPKRYAMHNGRWWRRQKHSFLTMNFFLVPFQYLKVWTNFQVPVSLTCLLVLNDNQTTNLVRKMLWNLQVRISFGCRCLNDRCTSFGTLPFVTFFPPFSKSWVETCNRQSDCKIICDGSSMTNDSFFNGRLATTLLKI